MAANESFTGLMDYLPDYYRGILEMETVQGVHTAECGDAWSALEDHRGQLNVDTATWMLDRWENELGLNVDRTKTYAARRERITAKLRGTGTTTPDMIRRTASAFSGGEVEVAEVPGEYSFEVRFVGTLGIPANLDDLIQIIEEIKPAHLTYRFQYTFTWWTVLKALTWSEAHAKTWEDLRVYE
ncbi:putative phage tail protein [Paenibacillus zanthoxyli]|uniref:putative phage tail protein n=1 Tax=Paenibacillus zanthoxyli TaxID=369399 RepID=UPI0004B85877|nr:putative phage tail protein [Paenibacillus zanthoxyli]